MTIRPDPASPHVITARGLVVVPLAIRCSVGLDLDITVVAIALAEDQLILVVPAHVLAAAMLRMEAGHVC